MAVGAEEGKHSSSGLEFKLHPLVLINVSDHFTRVKSNSNLGPSPIVLGCLLGAQSGRTVDVTNSFEIKHTTSADGQIIIDEPFLAKKQEQYKTVFPKMDVMGWYATGDSISDAHLILHRKVMDLNESPAFLLLNPTIEPTRRDLPVDVYETELHVVDGVPNFTFVKANFTIETSDAERIGVDQVAKILPSGKASGPEQLTAHLTGLHSAIKMLVTKLAALQQVLTAVRAGGVPYPHALMRQVASLVSSLPALDSEAFQRDRLTEINDTLATLYLASITKGLTGLNEVVDRFSITYEKTGRKGARGMPHMALGGLG